MRILWINPVGTAGFDPYIGQILKESARPDTMVDVVSLPEGRPTHLEYHAYEGLVIADIVRIVYAKSKEYDAVVIGCFYDLGLREAREVSGTSPVVAPCQASLVFASHLGNRFSVLVGRKKWIPKMEENVRLYGYGDSLASMRSLELGVHDFQADKNRTEEILLDRGKMAVEEDNAEVLILGCTIEFGFHEKMQDALGVPVIDAVQAPFKLAEMFADTADRFSWHPSRKWGSEEPPLDEIKQWGLFKNLDSIGNVLKHEDIP
jgi:allantoin racemase